MAKKIKGKNGGTLTPWQKGQSGNPSGRPRKVLTKLGELVGTEFGVTLSKDDKYSILESLLEMPMADLENIAADKDAPAFMVIAAKAIVRDASESSLQTLSSLLDRFHGKPKQVSEIEGSLKLAEEAMTDEKLEAEISRYKRISNNQTPS